MHEDDIYKIGRNITDAREVADDALKETIKVLTKDCNQAERSAAEVISQGLQRSRHAAKVAASQAAAQRQQDGQES